jgi:hypothetical protein
MFYNAIRPLYQYSEVIVLEKINRQIYLDFIEILFDVGNKKIEEPTIEQLLDFSDIYT